MWPTMQMKATRPTHRSQLSMERAKQISSEANEDSKVVNPSSNSGDAWPQATLATTATNGFDDDFADFVSAPAPATETSKQFSTEPAPAASKSLDSEAEEPQEEVEFHTAEDEDYKELLDEDMPSKEEILLASQRIFGQSMAPRDGDDDEEEEDRGEFDLGSIMGALASMKEEIAGISNEEEKRKAAARVALGLVWGLEGGRGL